MTKIPCSVCILTHNSAAGLARALESVRDFDEKIICDGGSTDATLEIAARYGARVILQDNAFKDSTGKITDFSGVRNQYLAAAAHDWIFALDSDERITEALAEEVRSACNTEPTAYWVLRKYEFKNTVIEHAMNYPARQMRFFHRAAVEKYFKSIHERILVKDGARVKTLKGYMIVPVAEEGFETVKRKWCAYIELERARRAPISLRTWVRKSAREVAIMGRYLFRLARVQLQKGAKFPIMVEVRIFWYQWHVIAMLFSKINRL